MSCGMTWWSALSGRSGRTMPSRWTTSRPGPRTGTSLTWRSSHRSTQGQSTSSAMSHTFRHRRTEPLGTWTTDQRPSDGVMKKSWTGNTAQ
eukprot:5525745-Alexandrium_andersonii.AAC.1